MRHALILAAGLGERMRPLTHHTPKPLLEVGGKPLIAWHLEKLAAADIRYVVINTSHLAAQFPERLGDGSRWGLRIRYAYEGPKPLETGGGMLHALPLLGPEPFIAISGDIWCDFDLTSLPVEPDGLAELVMVDNPPFHPGGDFVLDPQGLLHDADSPRLTFANIGIYRRELLADWPTVVGDDGTKPPCFKLAPLLRAGMSQGKIRGRQHRGTWFNMGTPEQLAELNHTLATCPSQQVPSWT